MKIKKILSALLVCVMVVCAMSFNVFADEIDVWDGKSYSLDWLSTGNPEGTSGDKFYLNSAKDLAGFAYYVNNYASTNNIFTGDTVYLNVDVDLGNHEWTPIGTMTTDKKHFYGSFDGQGHTISNLKISKESGQIYGGLFGRFKGNSFKQSFSNLIIHNVDIAAVASSDGKEGAGALMGYGYDQIIDNVHVTGNVNISGNYYVGGLAGHSRSNISNSTVEATGSITGVSVTGGLVGYFVHATGNGYTAAINDCSVDGVAVESTNKNAGGLVGFVSETNADKIVIDDVSVSNVTVSATNTNVSYVAHNFPTVTNATVENVATYVAGEETIPSDSEIVPPPAAKVNGVAYTDIQEAIKAAAPTGTVELLDNVTVDKWIMFSQRLSIGSGQIITLDMNGLTIKGNGKTLTVNSVESATNGDRLFHEADNLNIENLTINYADGVVGGISLKSGELKDVTINGGIGVLPGTGNITITGCAFNTNGSAIYNEDARDNLVVTGNTFNTAAGQYAIYLRGNTTFTNNTVVNGKVNVVSGSPVVTGNDFGNERFKVYNGATATIENNEINKLVFNDDSEVKSIFVGNTLSEDAQAVLDAAIAPAEPVKVYTYDELVEALEEDNANVIMMNDITATATQSSGYGKAGIVLDAGDVLDGNSYKLTINGANSTWDCAIAMRGGTVKNLTVSGAMRGIFMPGANGDVIIDSCKLEDVIYTFNSDAGSKDYTVTVKNTGLMGWTSFSDVHKSVTFENCTFGEGNGYSYCRPYQPTTFTGCEFNEGFEFDTSKSAADSYKFNDCTYAGKALSAETAAPMFSDGGTVIIDGETVVFTKYIPPVAKVGETKYATLEEAFKAVTAENNVVEILSDVTVDYYWDSRYTGAKFTVPVTINGNGHKLTFTNTVYDGGNQYSVFRFENDATVNNLTVDMKDAISGFQGRFRAISTKGNLTVSGCTFIGNGSANNTRAIIFGEGAGANTANLVVSITDSEFNGWRRAISDNENAQDSKSVTITGNKMTDASVYVSAHDEVVFNNNTVTDAYVNVKSYTANNTLDVTATGNTLTENTESKYNVIDAGGKINAQTGFVVPVKGSNSPAYTKEVNGYVRVWGEGGGNASESFVLKLYSGEELMATTQLNNIGGIIDGDVNVTWNFFYPESNDEYWTTTWEEGHPNSMAQPTEVVLYIDGVEVARTPAKMSGADDLNPIVWAELGGVAKCVAQICNTKYTSLQAAIDGAQEDDVIVIIENFDLDTNVTVANGKNITLDLNGKTITGTDNATGSFALIEVQPGAELIITDTSAEKSGKITLTSNNNRGWNAYSSVISNQRGKLIVNGGTIEHLGGTDMAYGIDNLTNGKGTYAETIINGGTIKSTYRGIRQFLNGIEAQNILTVNGGTIEGANKSIWMQDANASANPGKLTVTENASLNGDVYLTVTQGSTQWPVEVSIAAAALEGESKVLTNDNVPEGYEVILENGTYGVTEKAPALPTATVTNLGAITVDEYSIYNGSFIEGGDPIELQIAMEFIAQDTAETAKENYYADYTTDFFIKIEGMSGASFDGTGCYLAGHYGSWGWVKVPLDGMKIENGKVYPVITSVGLNFTYVDICDLVKDFKCGIYLTDKVLEENPNINLTLSLGLSETFEEAQAGDFINVDEVTYVKADFVGEEEPDIFGGTFAIINMEPTMAGHYLISIYSGIDSLNYREVGFEIHPELLGYAITESTNTVYTSITVPSLDGSTSQVVGLDKVGNAYRMFGTNVQLPVAYDNSTIYYRAYAIDLSGNPIYGSWYEIDDIYTLTSEEVSE